CLAGHDPELALLPRLDLGHLDAIHTGHRRGFGTQALEEGLDAVPLHLDEHAVDIVPDQPGEPEVLGKAMNEGAEAHPLHGACDTHGPPCHQSTCQKTTRLFPETAT